MEIKEEQGSERERGGKGTMGDRTMMCTEDEMSDGESQMDTDSSVVRERYEVLERMRGWEERDKGG